MRFRLGERQFTTVIGSDLDRDGMYLEVSEEKNGEPVVVLEIFYSDKSDKMTLSAFATDMPIELVDWATAMAKTWLPSSEKPERKQQEQHTIKNDNNILACRVCGLLQSEPPWGSDEISARFEICSCCGTEFGYQDHTVASTKNARQRWIDGGMKWRYPEEKPKYWSGIEQLRNVPERFQ